MLIVQLLVNENLLDAEIALSRAESTNLVAHCRKYLQLLTEYRDELYKLRSSPEISLQKQTSPLARELTEQVRKAIRSALEITTRERNQTEHLLESLTAISGYEAADTFNHLKYKGFVNWEMRASGVQAKGDNDALMPVHEAVERAGILRCEQYVTHKTVFLKHPGNFAATAETNFE
jgi:hypothetical protein